MTHIRLDSPVPTIFILDGQDDLEELLSSVPAYGEFFFTTPVDIESLETARKLIDHLLDSGTHREVDRYWECFMTVRLTSGDESPIGKESV